MYIWEETNAAAVVDSHGHDERQMTGSIQSHVACRFIGNAFIQPLHDAHYLMSARVKGLGFR